MKKIYFLGLLLTLTFQALSQNVVINEINADNPGGQDTREFIELFSSPFTSLVAQSGAISGDTSVTAGAQPWRAISWSISVAVASGTSVGRPSAACASSRSTASCWPRL